MRILHVLPRLAPGGMEKLVIQLTEDATRRGNSVVVASGPGAWANRITEVGAIHVALPATSRGSVSGMALATGQLAHCMKRIRPHIVHSHNVRATVLARLALGIAHHPAIHVTTLHGVAPESYGPASHILRHTCQRVIACAPSVARSLAAAGFPAARIEVISNCASLSVAGPERQGQLRQLLGVRTGRPLVIGIGRLVQQKNWPVFIAAADRLPGPQYVVAGDGPLQKHLVTLARRSGDRVRFLGPVDDIAALVGLATCLVSTSSWEGLPLTLLEALSVGTPVVATAVDGVADLIPPEAALLVAPDDPPAVSEAIARIITDQELATDLRHRALAAAQSWQPEQMLAGYRSAYRKALARAQAMV